MAGHEDKASRYIAALDTARVNGDWDQLPELIRKVNKHASKQTILVKTATAEHAVATGKFSLTDTQGPVQALESLLPTVSNSEAEHSFQARSCLIWARALGDASLHNDAQSSASLVAEFDQYGQSGTSAWTKICLVRSAYFTSGKTAQTDKHGAKNNLAAASAWIEQNRSLVEAIPQLAYWSQQLLAQNAILTEDSGAGTESTAKAYRLWSNIAGRRGQEISNRRYANTSDHVTRSQVWRRYYAFASQALQSGQLENSGLSRAEQANELRLVESAYESDLLATKKFPQATEGNAEVEQWVESVILNWRILSGPQFSESDLGQGGRNALTRNVLDILYRAASKTFHSLLILRRLFQVHKALAEFNLAYKSLDTYLELAERGRARSAKSHIPDPGQDSDETIMLTIAEGIEGLCAFGWQAEAQKAYDLTMKLETWIDQALEGSNVAVADALTVNGSEGNEVEDEPNAKISVGRPSKHAMQSINRAIGIGKAHWARWTPYGESRTELQAEALDALKSACSTSHPHPSSLYALALLLAETRDIPQAIKWTKVALQDNTFADDAAVITKTSFWHLLALLLSSKQDFETSSQSCAAAAQHLSRAGLFQKKQASSTVGATEKDGSRVAVTAQDLECVELQRVVELELSHLALTELLEGPEAALNNSNELFSLYSTLFSRFNVDDLQVATSTSKTLDIPKSSPAPARSIRGSMFSKRRDPTSPVARSGGSVKRETLHKKAPTSRPVTQASQAPTIQVTDESERTHRHHLFHHAHAHATRTNGPTDQRDGAAETHPTTNGHANNVVSDGGAKQPLGEIPHDLGEPKALPPPLRHDEQPPQQDNRLPHVNSRTTSTTPISRFSKVIAERHALTVLAKVWLVIATLYRRAHMFEDAKESCEEAAKIAAIVEAHVLAQDASAKALADCGWGGTGKSADTIWADVHCEKAELTLAIAHRHEVEGKVLPAELLREAAAEFEQCLMYASNHANGIVGLSGLLLDYYERKIELGKKVDDGRPAAGPAPVVNAPSTETRPAIVRSFTELSQHSHKDEVAVESSSEAEDLRKTPDNLNRIAARDRAYGLLSSLTKLGSDWDNSEAWFALARAHELGGEVEKAQNILWWCIELENTRPIRHWRNLSCTSYVL